VFGLGSDNCGMWLRHAQKEDAYHREAGIWLAGYLTANNQRLFATGLRATVGHGADVDSGIAWIDQYCQAHPLKYVMGGRMGAGSGVGEDRALTLRWSP
jgi:hypothetical protein